MKLPVAQIAALIQADVEGDPSVEIHHLAKIEEAAPGMLTFLANPKYTPYIYTTRASAVVVSREFVPQSPLSLTLLRCDDPYQAFTRLLELAAGMLSPRKSGIEQPSFQSEDATWGEDVYLGAFSYLGKGAKLGTGVKVHPGAYIGDYCEVGDHTILYPQVVLYPGVRVGKNCILHAGCRIGSDGFGFAPLADGTYQKIPQTGIVVLGDGVEVGANACIDRATLGATEIKEGVKLDNLVQIAHNVEVGAHSVIAAQTGIAGSTRLGKHCMIGGQVGIVGHLKIADGVKIDAQSGVNTSISEKGLAFRGSPVQPFQRQLRSELLFRKLEEMYKRIQTLEQALEQRD